MNLKNHIKIALGYFIIVALLGALLRMFQIVNISFNYKYILHAHSHISLLGWLYLALTTLIYKIYLQKKSVERKYKILFWGTQVTIIGMLITFPLTGYALLSIIFSTLFLFASYGFTILFLKYTSVEQKNTYSYKWIRASLWFMVLSSLGPWVLGIIMNTLGSDSVWYRNAIYFYLHFQYNGWFIIGLFGMLFYLFEKYDLPMIKKKENMIYWLFNFGVILTFFLSILWMKPHLIFNILSGVGGIFQLIAFIMIVRTILQNKEKIRTFLSKTDGLLLKTVAILFIIKLVFQILGSFPVIAEIVSSNKDLIIGYLHWVFLGIISISIFAFLHHFKYLVISKRTFIIYLIAFILTETLIFYKGTFVWLDKNISSNYYFLLFVTSSLFLPAIIGMLFPNSNRQEN